MRVPHGLDQIIEAFGDPRKFLLPDGTLSPSWETKNIVRVDLPCPIRLDFLPGDNEPMVSKITAHRLIADRIQEALEMIYERGLWEQLGGYSGGFAWRPIRGRNSISTHAWGIAWDFGASRDPLGDKQIDMPVDIVKIMNAYGFIWGGAFRRTDAMHFQFATGY